MNETFPLIARRCKTCGRIHYPIHDRCLQCKGRDFEEVRPEDKAKLLTYTAIFNLPSGFDQPYLILGVAEFANRLRILGQVRADSVDQLRAGMSVRAAWGAIRGHLDRIVEGLILAPLE